LPDEVDVTASDLGVSLDFTCGDGFPADKIFTNTTSGSIEVDTITKPSNCILTQGTTCFAAGEGPATVLAPTESCVVSVVIPSGGPQLPPG